MKKLLILFLSLSIFFPQAVVGHGSGFPPFFKINSKIADPYFLQNVGAFSTNINIPQDSAQRNFLIGEKINFEIAEESLATLYPPEIMDKIKYRWDYGDKHYTSGVKNSYAYKQNGSHILTITADFNDVDNPPQVIETALINVVPDNNYQLPKAVIKINNKKGNAKSYNILEFDLNNSLKFDSTESYSGSSKIVKYTWDFGDDQASSNKIANHQYQLPQSFATVVLRVTDENGFFADSYVNVKNIGENDPNNPQDFQKIQKIALTALIFVLFLGLGYGITRYKRKKK